MLFLSYNVPPVRGDCETRYGPRSCMSIVGTIDGAEPWLIQLDMFKHEWTRLGHCRMSVKREAVHISLCRESELDAGYRVVMFALGIVGLG
jgi:hypothetical protein